MTTRPTLVTDQKLIDEFRYLIDRRGVTDIDLAQCVLGLYIEDQEERLKRALEGPNGDCVRELLAARDSLRPRIGS